MFINIIYHLFDVYHLYYGHVIRNDLPNYLVEREAEGVSVVSWYHRQFGEGINQQMYYLLKRDLLAVDLDDL